MKDLPTQGSFDLQNRPFRPSRLTNFIYNILTFTKNFGKKDVGILDNQISLDYSTQKSVKWDLPASGLV